MSNIDVRSERNSLPYHSAVLSIELLPAVLVISILLGSCSMSYGVVLMKSLDVTSSNQRGESAGFLLFGPRFVNRTVSEIYMQVSNLDVKSNTAKVRMNVTFSVWSNPNKTIAFGAEVPHNFTGLEMSVGMSTEPPNVVTGDFAPVCGHPRFLTCKTGNVSDADVSYFYAIVNRSETSGELFSHFAFEVKFTWNNVTLQKSFTDFNLVVPFSTNFPSFRISEFDRLQLRPLWTDETKVSRLYVSLPTDSRVNTVNPSADVHTFSNNAFWYIWDVQRRSDPQFASSAFSLDFEMNNLVEEKEKNTFYSGIFLGAGIPIVLSSSVDLLRELASPKWSKLKKRYVLFALMIGVPIVGAFSLLICQWLLS